MRHRPLDVLIVLIALIAQKVQKKEESKTAFLFLICHFLYSLHRFHIIERTLSLKSDFAIIHDLFGTSDKQHNTTLGQ